MSHLSAMMSAMTASTLCDGLIFNVTILPLDSVTRMVGSLCSAVISTSSRSARKASLSSLTHVPDGREPDPASVEDN